MLITLKKRNSKVPFVDITVGNCFMYDDDVYLKISESKCNFNVFKFSDACIHTVYNDTLVEPLNMELVEMR